MSILDRDALEDSPLADLHAIASALSIDGYRRLRRADLIDAILDRQDGTRASAEPEPAPSGPAASEEPAPSGPAASEEPAPPRDELVEAVAEQLRAHDEGAVLGARRRRGRRGARGRSSDREETEARAELAVRDDERARAPVEPEANPERDDQDGQQSDEELPSAPDEAIVHGVVELLPNGSGFLRVSPPEFSDDDVYISAAQVKRCELVPGDRISGPRRAPRRSERFASLIRIDEINDRPADEVVVSTRFDELKATFPQERFRLGSEDPTVKAIEWLTPFGRGSRVTIAGAPQAGKTEALRRLAAELSKQEGIELSVLLVGVRPEELPEWAGAPVSEDAADGSSDRSSETATGLSFDASTEAQSQAVERIVDRGRRLASRGAHAVLLIDSVEGLAPATARRALHSARKIVDGGSLTVIVTAERPIGGETTVIGLDRSLASAGRFPALDLSASWTMHAERLVGEAGAEAIAAARAQALEEAQ